MYGMGMSRIHKTCPTCRFSTKDEGAKSCPHCHGKLAGVGKNFRPPRRTNKTQWRKIELALATVRVHHPNCYYSKSLRLKPAWSWKWCQCPSFKDFKTPADVKTGIGLRRSDRKHYARHHYRGGIPAGI
jgi:hypothetical protein